MSFVVISLSLVVLVETDVDSVVCVIVAVFVVVTLVFTVVVALFLSLSCRVLLISSVAFSSTKIDKTLNSYPAEFQDINSFLNLG